MSDRERLLHTECNTSVAFTVIRITTYPLFFRVYLFFQQQQTSKKTSTQYTSGAETNYSPMCYKMYTNNVINTFAHFISIGVIISDAVITFCFSQGTFEYNFTDPGEYDVEVMC